MHVRAAFASVSRVGKRTEQLGRSATDCAPTNEAATRVCSRKKHLIVAGLAGTAWVNVCTREVVEVK